MTYITNSGTQVTEAQIQAAFDSGKARIVHGYNTHGDGISSSLSLDGVDFDGRHKAVRGASTAGQQWTRRPEVFDECLEAAYVSSGWAETS